MITVAFCGHLPLQRCRSADAVISTGGFPSAACTVLHIHAIYRRVVAVLFFAAFFDLFCVFYANYYGKDCVSVIFLVFSCYLAKLFSILLAAFPILSGICGFAGRRPAVPTPSS